MKPFSDWPWHKISEWIISIAMIIFLVSLVVLYMLTDSYHLELSISHINEFRSRYEPVRVNHSAPCSIERGSRGCIGGLPRMITVINQLKKRNNFILVNAGNAYYGTSFFTVWKGEIVYKLFNMIPFDAHTLGSLEFILGIQELLPFIMYSKAPVVVCNMDSKHEPQADGIYAGSTIIYRSGVKIGIIGVISKKISDFAEIGNLTLLDESYSITKEARKLEKKGVFTIILISQMGYDRDLKLAEEVSPKISVIVGGPPRLLYNRDVAPDGRKSIEPYPTVVKGQYGHQVLVVNTAGYSRYIGNLTVFYDRNGRIKSYEGEAIYLDTNVKEDEKFVNELKDYSVEANLFASRIVVELTEDFKRETCYLQQCFLGDVAADSMVEFFKHYKGKGEYWTYASLAIVNPSSFDQDLKKGPLTYNQFYALHPYGNKICCVTIPGKTLREALEQSTTYYPDLYTNYSRRILQVSGILVTYNLTKPEGSRIQEMKVACQRCKVRKYEYLNESEQYRVVMSSYLSGGGNGYQMIADDLENLIPGNSDDEVYLDYFQTHPKIGGMQEKRITVVT